MIVMVSTKTLSALDPAHSDSTNPSEITSKRREESTSSMVGSMILLTASSVSAREEMPMTPWRTCSMSAGENWPVTKPIMPASAKTSGGTERIAKNAASAASPVTR